MEDTNIPYDEEFEHSYMSVKGPSHWERLATQANNTTEATQNNENNADQNNQDPAVVKKGSEAETPPETGPVSQIEPDSEKNTDEPPVINENQPDPAEIAESEEYLADTPSATIGAPVKHNMADWMKPWLPLILIGLAALLFLIWFNQKEPAPVAFTPTDEIKSSLPAPHAISATSLPAPTLGGVPTATNIPQVDETPQRTEIIEYTMEKGDTINSVAEKFGLAPETIILGNRYTVGLELVNYVEGVTLKILPVDGALYQWQPGNGLNGVARGYHVTADAIVDYPGNHLDRASLGDFSNPNIPANTWLIIPGAYDPEVKVPPFTGIYPEAKAKMLGFPEKEPSTAPREDLVAYITVPGDTLESIGAKWGLKPESVLWGNRYILGETPDGLNVNQRLLILPTDGVYYQWMPGDGLNGVAKYYSVSPDAIVDYPLNKLDRAQIGDFSNPKIKPGTLLVIPGGINPPPGWGEARVDDPNAAPGTTGAAGAHPNVGWLGVYECNPSAQVKGGGPITLPTGSTALSGYDWNPPTHYGVDYAGSAGTPIKSAWAGVIIYSGWSDRGYGNVIVVDHGGGLLTLYAHLLPEGMMGCGSIVDAGTFIGQMGSTGNSTGAHLHFEVRDGGSPHNPHDYGG